MNYEFQNRGGVHLSEKLDVQKISNRDKALVSILERVFEQLQVQETLVKELAERQVKISGAIEDSEFQRNLNRDEVDDGLKKLQDSFARYRSDMLTLVHEQDVVRDKTESTLENVNKLAYSLENTDQIVSQIGSTLEKQHRALHDDIAFTNTQWEKMPLEFANTNRGIAELHAETEKYFTQLQKETDKHFSKLQRETMRRLLILDKMMTALETLLVRTAPPDKKPFAFIRFFKIIGRFFKNIRNKQKFNT
jgi:chromosome segregation ATPase